MNPEGIANGKSACTVATKTIENFVEKASRLYEQERSAVLAAPALEMYVKRWARVTTSGRMTLITLAGAILL